MDTTDEDRIKEYEAIAHREGAAPLTEAEKRVLLAKPPTRNYAKEEEEIVANAFDTK